MQQLQRGGQQAHGTPSPVTELQRCGDRQTKVPPEEAAAGPWLAPTGLGAGELCAVASFRNLRQWDTVHRLVLV